MVLGKLKQIGSVDTEFTVRCSLTVIDNLNLARGERRDQDVLRLHVAVDHAALVQALEREQALLGHVA